jgi:CRP-like cAMP-binding protein
MLTTTATHRLSTIPGIGTLPAATLDRIDSLSTEVRVPEGRVLIWQKAPGRQTFLITEGIAAIRCDGQTVAKRTPGSVVGEAAVLHRCPRSADVVAETDMTVLVLSPAELASLYDDPAFRTWLDDQVEGRAAAG